MRAGILAAAILLPAVACAIDRPEPPPEQNPLGWTSDFLLYHPDQSHRFDGLKAYEDGNYGYARGAFEAGSRFADKASQAMLASMYWDGRGVAQDRALGYVWMDLAAERGYPWLVASRERYWAAMSDSERQHALAIGPSVFDEYGDAAALPRLRIWMHRGVLHTTGSHTGFVGALEIYRKPPGADGNFAPGFDGNQYFAARYWKEQDYLGWQNSAWHPESKGKVDVGVLEPVRGARSAEPRPRPDATDPGAKPGDPGGH